MIKATYTLYFLVYSISIFSMNQQRSDRTQEMSEQEIQHRRNAMQKRTVTREAIEILGLKTPRSDYQAALKETHKKLIEHDEESLDQQLTTRSKTSDSSPIPLTTDMLTAKQLSDMLKDASDRDTEIKSSVAGKKRIKNAVSSVLLIGISIMSIGTQAYSLTENIKSMDNNSSMHQTRNMTMTNSNSYKSETLLADIFSFIAPMSAIASGIFGLVGAWRNTEGKIFEQENQSNDLTQGLIQRLALQSDILVKINQKKCEENRTLTSRLASPSFAFSTVKFNTQTQVATIPRAISSSPDLDDMEKGKFSGTGSSTTQPSNDLRSVAAAVAIPAASSSSQNLAIVASSSSAINSSVSNTSGSSDSSGSSGS